MLLHKVLLLMLRPHKLLLLLHKGPLIRTLPLEQVLQQIPVLHLHKALAARQTPTMRVP